MPCRTRYCSYSRDKENSSVSIILYFHWWISWFCLCFILDCLHFFLPMYRHLPVFFLPFSHNFRLFNPTTCPLILYKFTHICTRTLKFSLHFLVFTVLPNDEGVTINHPCNVPSESGSLAGEWALWCPRSCILWLAALWPRKFQINTQLVRFCSITRTYTCTVVAKFMHHDFLYASLI